MGDNIKRVVLIVERGFALAAVLLRSGFCEQAMSRKKLLIAISRIELLTSGTSFSLRRSRGGNRIISALSLCSAASPDTGLASTVGLSFAETHGATPGSGRSRPTFARMPAINWLCKCSVIGSTVTWWSIWKESSF